MFEMEVSWLNSIRIGGQKLREFIIFVFSRSLIVSGQWEKLVQVV